MHTIWLKFLKFQWWSKVDLWSGQFRRCCFGSSIQICNGLHLFTFIKNFYILNTLKASLELERQFKKMQFSILWAFKDYEQKDYTICYNFILYLLPCWIHICSRIFGPKTDNTIKCYKFFFMVKLFKVQTVAQKVVLTKCSLGSNTD